MRNKKSLKQQARAVILIADPEFLKYLPFKVVCKSLYLDDSEAWIKIGRKAYNNGYYTISSSSGRPILTSKGKKLIRRFYKSYKN